MHPRPRLPRSSPVVVLAVLISAGWGSSFLALACTAPSATGASTLATATPATPAGAAAPPAPALEPAPRVPADRAFGTAHPTVLLAAARDGTWLAICQAREDTDHDGRIAIDVGRHGERLGDQLVPYLLLGPGPGRAISRFVRSDSTGRWLVYVRDGKRWLLDTRTKREVDLDGRRAPQRTIAAVVTAAIHERAGGVWEAGLDFDAAGERLLFVVFGPRGRPLAILRHLVDGREVEIDSGPGWLSSAAIAPDGPYVVLRVAERDTNHDGVVRAPRMLTDRDGGPCSTTFDVAMTATPTTTTGGDELSFRVARLDERVARPAPGFETIFGDNVVRRSGTGALELEGPGGVRELFPSECGARVLKADPARDLLAVACMRRQGDVEILHDGQRVPTGCRSASPEHEYRPSERLACVGAAGSQNGLLSDDFETLVLAPDGRIDARSALAGPAAPWQRRPLLPEPQIKAPDVELCSRYWTVDLRTGDARSPGVRRVTLGTTSGQVLAASGVLSPSSRPFARGPLFWMPAIAPGATCPSFEQAREDLLRRHPKLRPGG